MISRKPSVTFHPDRNTVAGDIGRASKGAAIGMLMKVYLTLGNYQKVVDLYPQLNGHGYALNANYSDNFNPATQELR